MPNNSAKVMPISSESDSHESGNNISPAQTRTVSARAVEGGGSLENAQLMAAHENPRTRNFTTAPVVKSRSTKSNGSRSETRQCPRFSSLAHSVESLQVFFTRIVLTQLDDC